MPAALIHLKILLPFRIFTEKSDISRIVMDTKGGSFGLLPHRLDCVAALVPGILIYENTTDGEICLAVDEGVLVKSGLNVTISVRRAIAGTDLSQLHKSVEQEFLALSEQEQSARAVTAKLEVGFLQRYRSLKNG